MALNAFSSSVHRTAAGRLRIISGCAALLFLLPAWAGATGFATSETLAAGDAPRAVAAADYDKDGSVDLAVTGQGDEKVTLWYGNRAGEREYSLSVPAGNHRPTSIVSGDFNEDGSEDIAVSSIFSRTLGVLIQTETTFAPAVTYPHAGYALIAADFNADTHLDLATPVTSGTYVHLGVGDGTFLPPRFSEGWNSFAFGGAAADIDGDGFQDLAVSEPPSTGTRATILRGDGEGMFSYFTSVPTGNSPRELVVADLNLDGRLDLAAANQGNGYGPGSISVAWGGVESEFSAPVFYLEQERWRGLATGDFDADGLPDLTASSVSGKVAVLRNLGNGEFTPAEQIQIGGLLLDVVAEDLNRDVLPDLAVVNLSRDAVTVFYNTLQMRGSALAPVQKTRVASPFEWYQELLYNYATGELTFSPTLTGTGAVSQKTGFGHWTGMFHYDFTRGSFTQARYSSRQILLPGGSGG